MTPQQTAIRLAPEQALVENITTEAPLVSLVPPLLVPADVVVPMSVAPWQRDSLFAREATHRRLLAVADIVAVLGVLLLVLSHFGATAGALVALAAVPGALLLFNGAGLYSREQLRLGHSTLDEAPRLLQLTGLLTLASVLIIPSVLSTGLRGREIVGLWLAFFVAVVCGRMLARLAAGRMLTAERCLVIGELGEAARVREKIATSPARASVVGCLPMASEDIAELRDPEIIRSVVDDLGIHRIIIAGTTAVTDGVDFIRIAKALGVRVSVVPRMFDVVGSAVEFDEVEGMTMLGVARFGLSRGARLLKRGMDLAVSGVALIMLSPVLSAIALAIRMDSKGPIFFRQVRVGRDGREFRIVKFRSMVTDAEARKDALRAHSIAGEGLFKITDDPRITRVGRFLRRSSLDELPQLLNVLIGDMSLVGPRPLVVDEDSQILGIDRSRLHLPPGMTGPWQLLRSRVPLQEMVEIDYAYTANWSVWLDLKIMLRTVGHVLRRGNV